MKGLGVNVVNDPVYPDLVFGLRHPISTNRESNEPVRKPKIIGVGVMTYYGWQFNVISSEILYETYIEKVTKFVQWLLNHEYDVRILIGEDSDYKAASDLLKNVQTNILKNTKHVISYEPARTIYDVFSQISETDIVVASRFHNIVCALMLNKPVVSLSYADKNDALMAEMGLANYCQHITEIDVELLVEQFQDVVSNGNRLLETVIAKNLEYRESLESQFLEISSRFNIRT